MGLAMLTLNFSWRRALEVTLELAVGKRRKILAAV